MAYGPTSPLGGSRIFYSSSILWDSDLSSIRVKIVFINSNIRISCSHPPGDPLITNDHRQHQKIPKIISDVLLRHFCPPPLQIPYHCYILMNNYIHLPFLHSIPLILLLQGATNCSPLFRESFELTACNSCRMNTPKDNTSHLSRICSSPLDSCTSQKPS